MSDQQEIFKKLPGVLSFQRGLALSDGLFFNRLDDGTETPVMVVRHGIRGTQNVSAGDIKADPAQKAAKKTAATRQPSSERDFVLEGTDEQGVKLDATTKDTARRDVSNIQITDTAKLDPNATGLVVRFSLRFLDLDQVLFAVAAAKGEKDGAMVGHYRDSVERFIATAKDSEGLQEVARRLARNIANGRWLWRNRTLAKSVGIETHRLDGNPLASFDALAIPLNHFDQPIAAEHALAEPIIKALRGDEQTSIAVEARIDFGLPGAIEVFPSQNYVEKKPKGFARPLYCVGHPEPPQKPNSDNLLNFKAIRAMGQAALRDQKISNAIRTIDTWYPTYTEQGRPIAVEPNGASLDAQTFFRTKKTSAFEFARHLNVLDPDTPDGQFMIACLIRGGVLSGGD